jgi:DNA-binding XRE family transcriptional regulator
VLTDCETLLPCAPDAIVSSTSERNTPFRISQMEDPKTRIPVLVLGVLRFFWHFLGRRFAKLRFEVAMQIGERLRCLRKHRNLSQDEVARRTGLVQRYISWMENSHAVPKLETLEKCVRAIQVPLCVFFYDE